MSAAVDITGQTRGCYAVLGRAPRHPARAATQWRVRCERCGAAHVRSRDKLERRPRACAACAPRPADMTGRRVGVFVVLRRASRADLPRWRAVTTAAWWHVRCARCGADHVRPGSELRTRRVAAARWCGACRPNPRAAVRFADLRPIPAAQARIERRLAAGVAWAEGRQDEIA